MELTNKERFWEFYDRQASRLNKVVNPEDLLPYVGHLIPQETQVRKL